MDKFKKVSLEEMFKILMNCVLTGNEAPCFYYKTEPIEGTVFYDKIKSVDLMDERFTTEDNDFSQYEWEMGHSNIYMKINEEENDG